MSNVMLKKPRKPPYVFYSIILLWVTWQAAKLWILVHFAMKHW